MAAITRVTGSISALTKFSVTGVREFIAGPAGTAAAGADAAAALRC